MSNKETNPQEISNRIEQEVGDSVAEVAEPPAPAVAPNIHQMRKILKDMSDDMKAILQRENLKRTKSETANRTELSSAKFKESELGAAYSQLYPSHDDPAFTVQLAEKKEFYDTHNPLTIDDVERQSEKICRGEFELAPHQMFIRNFLSPQTPYNSILLYHGLGTGKTCTAASACETARDYSKQIGDPRRIIVVASPNVLENFQRQLFNESKLREVNGVWNIRACTGNKFLREINPMNTRGLARDVVVRQIRRIINESYAFLGYGKFANYIQRTLNRYKDPDPAKQERLKTLALRREFSNRMIVIDEVHNIRIVGDVIGKAITSYLLKLVMAAENVKLLLMSATPMYNSAEEIIWLLNLMNANDRRSRIRVSDVFNPDGTFRRDSTGAEVGKQILMNKARGYISYVRGENPYSFPYRIYPSVFAPERSILSAGFVNASTDLVGRPIGDEERISVLDLYAVPAGIYQGRVYLEILRQLREKLFGRVARIGAVEEGAEAGQAEPNQLGGANGVPQAVAERQPQAEAQEDAEDAVGGLGYSSLEPLIQSLNIVYPNPEFDDMDDGGEIPKYTSYIGEEGLKRIVTRTSKNTLYEYKPEILARYGRIFDPDQIGKYSAKITSVCEAIRKATGIVLVFSQYIPGGCIPIALALEAMGLTRYTGAGGNQLWKERVPEERRIVRGSYVMITANGTISPNNDGEVRAVTAPDNVNGEKIRVVIISRAGSEGIDFQNLRQVHIMEPWYNVSRQEQIIGRAIRYCSHIELPFRKRNAEIFQYATTLPVELAPREEAADLYVYRIAEKKAIKTGIVSRVLKETAVDCLLNEEQNSITEAELGQTKTLELADGKEIEYHIGDKPYTALCDFMGECEYLCRPEPTTEQRERFGTRMDTYSESFIQLNIDSIIRNIRELFKTETVFSKKELVRRLKLLRNYPDIQIDSALDYLIKNSGEYLIDGSGRMGRMVNVGDTYAFQPIEITDDRVGRFERTYPVDFKHHSMRFILPAKEGEISGERVVVAAEAAPVGPAVSAIAPRAEVGAPAAAAAAVPAPSVSAPPLSSAVADILSTMETEFNRTLRPGGSPSDAPDWFDAVRKAREHLNETYGIDSTELNQLVVAHQIDSLMPIDKMRLLSWLISPERRLLTEYKQALVYYLESSLIVRLPVSGAATGAAAAASGAGSDADEMSCFIILNTAGTSIATFVYPLDGSPIRTASIRESERINERLEPRLRRGMKPNTIFGFIEIFKEQGYMIMKTRDMTIERTKGARCDQKTKSKIIALLNSIVGKAQYSIENTKKRFDPMDLCMITEIVLRKFDRDNKDGKRWFYLPEHYRILASGLE